MTPEEVARLVLSDCQDPDLRAKAARENDEALAESMKDPAFKAAWDANMQRFADAIDTRFLAEFYGEFFGER